LVPVPVSLTDFSGITGFRCVELAGLEPVVLLYLVLAEQLAD
jgi:hypothetical protein